jgi:hypothetical protein
VFAYFQKQKLRKEAIRLDAERLARLREEALRLEKQRLVDLGKRARRRRAFWEFLLITAAVFALIGLAHFMPSSPTTTLPSKAVQAETPAHNYNHGPVHVQEYRRRDGTVVHEYSRSRPTKAHD